MATYSNDWLGLDRGHEGIWNPAIWAGVIQTIYDCGGTVDFSDFTSHFYQKLAVDFPSVSWSSADKNGANRSLFRDAREPWVTTRTLNFNGNQISITDIGLSVIRGDVSYGEVLIETFKSYNETGTNDNPFSIICNCLLALPTGNAISIEDVIKIMRHFRPDGDDLLEALATKDENVSTVTERRLKNIMTLLSYSGALTLVGKDYYLASRSVAEEITGRVSARIRSSRHMSIGSGVHQLIIYGAPGTGKSHKIDMCTNESNSIRVTFHPDTDYAAFVGTYKPFVSEAIRYGLNGANTVAMKVDGADLTEDKISYKFVPQAFMKAYVEAWRRYTDTGLQGDAKTYYLVIEEINRGNCAQIFGDLFQLLDRADNGFSAYAITPDDDIQKFLETDKDYKLSDIPLTADIKKMTENGEKVIATAADIKTGKKLVLPPNLYIWATMNTSDQSLFPIDSAFKRRWEWEYVPITNHNKGWKIVVGQNKYDWWEFLKEINSRILKAISSADKQLGYFFVKLAEGTTDISLDTFVNKVLFYLWTDVFKDCELKGELKDISFESFFKDDSADIDEAKVTAFLNSILVKKETINP